MKARYRWVKITNNNQFVDLDDSMMDFNSKEKAVKWLDENKKDYDGLELTLLKVYYP